MAMPFWATTDYDRIVDLMNAAEGGLSPVAPWAGFTTIYDPESFVAPPTLSDDPEAPTIFCTWGFDAHVPVETQDPDTAGTRSIEVAIAFFQQKPASGGAATTGATRLLAAALWTQLQAASITGLYIVPQSMRWQSPPLRDFPDFFESRMTVELSSQ